MYWRRRIAPLRVTAGLQKEHVETQATRSWLENLSLVSDAVPAMLGQLGVTMSMVHTCLEYLVEKVGATSWPKHSTALNGIDGTWTETSLEKLLKDPQGSFPGLNKNIQVRFKKSRTALIAYLKTL